MNKYNFYCIAFEEDGCRKTPCKTVCNRCKGWLSRKAMNDLKQGNNKEEKDTNGVNKEGNN